uniref:Tabimmunregulin 11 n=1 Tax=Tabanus yao TaxID=485572 RepID=C1IC03_TABYA|nr:tabimmunregulin 11 [Tabanus yao]
MLLKSYVFFYLTLPIGGLFPSWEGDPQLGDFFPGFLEKGGFRGFRDFEPLGVLGEVFNREEGGEGGKGYFSPF